MGFGWFFKFGLAKAAQNIRFLSIFNGIDRVTGDTFTSSGQTTTDYLGASVTVPANVQAVTGARRRPDYHWSAGTGWTIANGVATHNGAFGRLTQCIGTDAGDIVRVTGTATYTSGGSLQIGLGDSTSVNISGSFSVDITALSSRPLDFRAGTWVGTVTNIAAYKLVAGVPTGPNLVQNGSFSDLGSWKDTTPHLVAVTGDSIAAGHNTPNGYLTQYEGGPSGDLDPQPIHQVRRTLDISYENHAKGGQDFSWVLSTGAPAAIATGAKTILIHCGTNDVAGGRTWLQIRADLDAIKSQLGAGQKLFISGILPRDFFNDTQAATIREYNGYLSSWCSDNSAVFIDTHDAMGQVRPSTGMIDDLNAEYNYDDTHLTQKGVNALAQLWVNAVLAEYAIVTGDVVYPYSYPATYREGSVKVYYDADPTNFKRMLIASGVVYARPTSGVFQTNNHGCRIRLIPAATGQSGWAINTYTSASAEYGVTITATTVVLRKRNASTDTDVTVNYTHTQDVPLEIDFYTDAGSGMGVRCREYSSGVWQAWSAWSEATTAAAKADATVAATYQIGSRNGANQFAGNYQYAAFVGGDNVKSKLENL